MFRTDIGDGTRVSSEECTTRFGRLFCDPCETKYFLKIDGWADSAWKKILSGCWPCDDKKDSIMMMKVAVSSMIARAVYVSLPDNHPKCCKRLIRAIKKLKTRKDKKDKKTLKDTVEETKSKLDEIGFLWYELPSHVPNYNDRKYRVEFPFRCALKSPALQDRILIICAQVPPYFCLLPYQPKDKELLSENLHVIAITVQNKLNEKLQNFTEEEREKSSDFRDWYTEFHAQNGPGPLLVFDYLRRTLPYML